MIRNILFDMGSVLVDFNPLRFTMEAKLSPEDAQLVREELFRSIEWAQLDRGTLTDRALLEIMKPRFPERLWPTLEWMICRWDEPPVMVEGMYELVQELSEAGCICCPTPPCATTNTGPATRCPASSGTGC